MLRVGWHTTRRHICAMQTDREAQWMLRHQTCDRCRYLLGHWIVHVDELRVYGHDMAERLYGCYWEGRSMSQNMSWRYTMKLVIDLYRNLTIYSQQRHRRAQRRVSVERSAMRLRHILLSNARRPTELLQQPHCSQSHQILHRCFPSPTNTCLHIFHTSTAYTGGHECSPYRHTILRNHSPAIGLQEGATPNSRRRRCHWRPLRRDHRRSGRCLLLDVQAGEEAKEAQGALRGAV